MRLGGIGGLGSEVQALSAEKSSQRLLDRLLWFMQGMKRLMLAGF